MHSPGCMGTMRILFTLWAIVCLLAGFGTMAPAQDAGTIPPEPEASPHVLHGPPRVALLLDASLGDGFDFPVGDAEGKGSYRDKATRRQHQGWSATGKPGEPDGNDAKHTGEAWNGKGGGATDAGQPVHAIASGEVLEIQDGSRGQTIVIEHRFMENGRLRTIRSSYAGIEAPTVQAGDTVKRRQQIAVIARGEGEVPTQLYLEIKGEALPAPIAAAPSPEFVPPAETPPSPPSASPSPNYLPPSTFIREHRRLLVPASAPEVFIAMKRDYRLYHVQKGKLVRTIPIALSQDPIGPKQQEGDNRTPEGEYHVTQKAKGPFEGKYGAYLGAAWIRFSFPNAFDARAALAKKRITPSQCVAITSAISARRMPPAKTPLGGGVGIHGWISDWPEDGQHDLTWGCLSLRRADLLELYGLMKEGATLVIHP